MSTSALHLASAPAPAPATGFRKILLTTDFSAASRAALPAALDLATLFGAKLSILHVFEYAESIPPLEAGEMVGSHGVQLDARNRLSALKREAAQAGVTCDTVIRAGRASDAIQEFIEAENIDLTVMGTSALHGFERLIFGSTAEAVLRQSPTPVIVVGPRADAAAVAQKDRPVVFATDFHATTVQAIRLAGMVSQATGSHLHCVHVLPRALEGASQAAVIPGILIEALHHMASTSGVDTAQPICATTFGSEVSNAVVDYARQHNAKLIVLGIRQASLASTHTPAHIAYRIVTEAPCPVLTMAFEQHNHFFSSLAACV